MASTIRPFLIAAVAGIAAMAAPQARADGPYRFPLRADALETHMRYSTFTHKAGIQGEGHDIGAKRLMSNGSNWSGLTHDKGDSKVLSHWLVYGKPFYAMAPGTVVACWRNTPDNPPGGLHPDYGSDRIPRGGNHLWILQDDGRYALYAHARPGSIPASLCPHNATLLTNTARNGGNPDMRVEAMVTNGARISTGQKLGEIGNSGSSGGPHLHVHMERGGKPMPIPFARGMSTSFAGDKASLDGPWARTAGKPLPKGRILIWAPRPVGHYTWRGTPLADYQRLHEHMADSGMMPKRISCASNGARYGSTWMPASGAWFAHHNMNATQAAQRHADYTAKGYTRTSSYTCGQVTVAVWRK